LAATECEEEVACTAGTPWTEVAITDIGVTGSQVVIKAANVPFTNGMKVKLSGILPTEMGNKLNDKVCEVITRTDSQFTCHNLNPKAAADDLFSADQPDGGLAIAALTYDKKSNAKATAGGATNTGDPKTYPGWTAAIGGQYVSIEDLKAGDDTDVAGGYSDVDVDGKKRWRYGTGRVHVCRTCPVGKRNKHSRQRYGTIQGDVDSVDEQCSEELFCAPNHYIDANHACVACPSNSFRPGKLATPTDSVWPKINGVSVVIEELKSSHELPANLVASANTAEAWCKTTCEVNEYVKALASNVDTVADTYACVACPKGKNRKAGDILVRDGVSLPAGSQPPVKGAFSAPLETSCSTIYCPDNTHTTAAGTCCACEPGKIKTAASKSDGALTSTEWLAEQNANTAGDKVCDDVFCGTDFYNTGASPPTGDTPYQCKLCPAGKTNPAGDKASEAAAGTCSTPACGLINGIYHRMQGGACVPCETWQTSVQATDVTSGTADEQCVDLPCPEDYYVKDDKWHSCVKCADGANDGFGAGFTAKAVTSRAVPTKCTIGKCAANEFVDFDQSCSACPLGTTSPAGIPRTAAAKKMSRKVCTNSGQDDFVYGIPCEEGFHVKDHTCVQCPTGQTNAAGDDPILNVDTYCDEGSTSKGMVKHSECTADHRVVNHKCVRCPIGTKNDAGDDPHYFDTECEAEICKENYRVSCTGGTEATTDPKVRECKCVACDDPDATHTDKLVHYTNTAGDDCSKNVNTDCV
jgi:hypothetical protein